LFSKILVPVDGSDVSYRALDAALFFSEKMGSIVTIVHVIENVPTVYIESQKILDELLNAHRDEGKKILDKCLEIAERKGIMINTNLLQGSPGSSILEFANEGNFDAITIGSHGKGGFKEMLLGSVSSKIVHHFLQPVLLIK
jgi:nucleotide-binding universal stress UspA family protein